MKTKTPQENPEFHLGQLIKAELAHQGRTATWLAKQVHCTPENIYKTYRQKWVTMPLLFEISKALDCDFLAYRSKCRLKKTSCSSMGHFAG